MTLPDPSHSPTISVTVHLGDLAEAAEVEHAAAQRAGQFDRLSNGSPTCLFGIGSASAQGLSPSKR